MDITQRLIDFAEAGNQQKIILANGQVLQGWIMEITDEALLISTGFSDKVGKDCWIKLDDLTQAQLSYWDNHNDVWQAFIL
ncbi:hypothetical protein [Acinetobacter puyangensis]|uniref:hypothetical protein n=1 Tax=Acinetobacter puyangensis TaxID=1096779 RepID=UPI003A4DFE69